MKVRTTCTIKGRTIGVISKGTIFEGTKETLPNWILPELALKRGTLEVLPELKVKGKTKAPRKTNSKPPVKSEKKPNGKPATLREKLSNGEK